MPHHLIRKLERFTSLSAEEKNALLSLGWKTCQLKRDEEILRQGDNPKHASLILDGWACRYSQLEDGRRQIVSLLLPGDLCDPYIFHLDRVDHAVATLTPVTIGRVLGWVIQDVVAHSPALREAFLCEVLVTAAIQREWTASLGSRTGIERLAHLFCELHARLAAVGLTQGNSCPMPITQNDLADALGQTGVHINRTLKELRSMGLITLRGRRLTIHDPAALARLAQFDPAYLHLRVDADCPVPLPTPAFA